MLKLHFKDRRLPPFVVVEKLYTLGSAPDNHLVLRGDHVAPLHARLLLEDGKYLLKDNNTQGGCYINGQRVSEREIVPGDILRLGDVEIIVLNSQTQPDTGDEPPALPWRLISEGHWLGGKQFLIHANHPMVVGRDNQCDIVIPGSHLSRRHCEIQIEGEQLRIRDLGSANGTYLNENKIDSATARNGDCLRLDLYTFRLAAPDSDWYKPRKPQPFPTPKPIERKQLSTQPKRWKTRPTSPGNRIELPLPARKRNHHKALIAGVLLLSALAIAAVLLN